MQGLMSIHVYDVLIFVTGTVTPRPVQFRVHPRKVPGINGFLLEYGNCTRDKRKVRAQLKTTARRREFPAECPPTVVILCLSPCDPRLSRCTEIRLEYRLTALPEP